MTGLELKVRRVQLGLTQADFAVAIGRSAQSVSQWERDVVTIPLYLELALEGLEARVNAARTVYSSCHAA